MTNDQRLALQYVQQATPQVSSFVRRYAPLGNCTLADLYHGGYIALRHDNTLALTDLGRQVLVAPSNTQERP